jgi:hypothetical protein
VTQLLFGHDAEVLNWYDTKRLRDARYDYALGIIDGDMVLRGALLVKATNTNTAALTIYNEGASLAAVARPFFKAFFTEYYRLEIRTQRTNKAIKKAAPKMGFKFEGVARDFYGPGDDALCFYMNRDNCRWINGRFERRTAKAA